MLDSNFSVVLLYACQKVSTPTESHKYTNAAKAAAMQSDSKGQQKEVQLLKLAQKAA